MVRVTLKDRAIAVAAATLATALPCSAQVSVELTPVVGVYVPTARILDGSHTFCTLPLINGVADFCGAVMRQKRAAAVGGRITGWLDAQTAVDLSIIYSASRVTGFPPINYEDPTLRTVPSPSDTSAHVVAGSARILFSVARVLHGSFYVAAGLSFVAHGGDAYAGIGQSRAAYGSPPGTTTGWGPTVGAGVRLSILPLFAISAELTDYNYIITGGQDQNDLVFSLGLFATLLGRSGASAPPPSAPEPPSPPVAR